MSVNARDCLLFKWNFHSVYGQYTEWRFVQVAIKNWKWYWGNVNEVIEWWKGESSTWLMAKIKISALWIPWHSNKTNNHRNRSFIKKLLVLFKLRLISDLCNDWEATRSLQSSYSQCFQSQRIDWFCDSGQWHFCSFDLWTHVIDWAVNDICP